MLERGTTRSLFGVPLCVLTSETSLYILDAFLFRHDSDVLFIVLMGDIIAFNLKKPDCSIGQNNFLSDEYVV